MSNWPARPERDPAKITRRDLLLLSPLVTAFGVAAKYGVLSEEEPAPIKHTVTQDDLTEGIVGIIRSTFPELGNEEALHYFGSGAVKNLSAEADRRGDSYNILIGDILELPHPTED